MKRKAPAIVMISQPNNRISPTKNRALSPGKWNLLSDAPDPMNIFWIQHPIVMIPALKQWICEDNNNNFTI